jgi:hypothetical protein
MNCDREIEAEGKEGEKVILTVGELHSLLLADLSQGDLGELAGELLSWLQ